MANVIDIVIRAKDEVSSVFKNIANAMGVGEKNAAKMALGFTAISAAAGVVATAIKESVNSTVEYANAVEDMMRITGRSSEETSRLVTITDKLSISQKDLAKALADGVKKGTDVSIVGLARLSDEYLKLNKGAEQSEFLLDKFGKSGAALAPLMERGAEGIAKMYGAVEDGFILTQQAIDQSSQYQETLAELDASYKSIGMTIGQKAIPPLNDFLKLLDTLIQKKEKIEGRTLFEKLVNVQEERRTLYQVIQDVDKVVASIQTVDDALDWIRVETAKVVRDRMENEFGITQEFWDETNKRITAEIKAQDKFYQEMISNTQNLMKMNEKYAKSIDDVTQEHAELVWEKERLISEGYWPESEAIQGINEKIDESTKKYWSLKEAQEKERMQMLINIATEGLDYQSKLNILFAMGQLDAASYNNMTTLGELRKQYQEGTIDANNYKFGIDLVNKAMSEGKSVDVNYTVHMRAVMESSSRWADIIEATGGSNVTKAYTDATEYTRGGGLYGDIYAATGANFTVPPGFPNDSFRINATSGEHVVITPPGEKTVGGSGASIGGVTVNLVYNPVVSMADRYEAETKLVPYIESALRKIR